MKRLLLAFWAVFFYFHAVRMGFFVFGEGVVFLIALGASQSELNTHFKSSNQSLVYCIFFFIKMQA
jgi:hypothetical protein